jgi:signal transduction histidine kinase
MEDLSLHILDIVENSTRAGATLVKIKIIEDKKKDLLQIVIKDNGSGMDREMVKKVRDPFMTTRTTRRVGLGLSMLEQAAKEAGGDLSIVSEPGRGTEVKATFQANHIDRKPIGDMGSSMISLIAGNTNVDFIYESDLDGEKTTLDTRMIKEEMEGVTTINDPAVLKLIRGLFKKEGD